MMMSTEDIAADANYRNSLTRDCKVKRLDQPDIHPGVCLARIAHIQFAACPEGFSCLLC